MLTLRNAPSTPDELFPPDGGSSGLVSSQLWSRLEDEGSRPQAGPEGSFIDELDPDLN